MSGEIIGVCFCEDEAIVTYEKEIRFNKNYNKNIPSTHRLSKPPAICLSHGGVVISVRGETKLNIHRNRDESSAVDLKGDKKVFALFGLPHSQQFFLCCDDGTCQVRSINDDNKGVSKKVFLTNDETFVTALDFPSHSCVALLKTHQTTLPIDNPSAFIKNSFLRIPATLKFGLSLLNKATSSLHSFVVDFDSLEVESKLKGKMLYPAFTQDGDKALIPCVTSSTGGKLWICKPTSETTKIEAWDFVYGVKLESHLLQSPHTVQFLSSSPSGDKLAVGYSNHDEIDIIKIGTEDKEQQQVSIARALRATWQEYDEAVAESGGKRQKVETEKSLLTGLRSHLASRRRRTLIESNCKLALEKKWYDALLSMVNEGWIESTSLLQGQGNSPLVDALALGRLDFCLAVIKKCPDVKSVHLVDLLRYVLRIASTFHKKKEEVFWKVIDETYHPDGDKKDATTQRDHKISLLVTDFLLCPHLVDSQLLSAFRELKEVELSVLLTCLRYRVDQQGDLPCLQRMLALSSLLLDAQSRTLVEQQSSPATLASIIELKNLVNTEIAICEKSEQVLNRVEGLLQGTLAAHQTKGEVNAEYRVEVINL